MANSVYTVFSTLGKDEQPIKGFHEKADAVEFAKELSKDNPDILFSVKCDGVQVEMIASVPKAAYATGSDLLAHSPEYIRPIIINHILDSLPNSLPEGEIN